MQPSREHNRNSRPALFEKLEGRQLFAANPLGASGFITQTNLISDQASAGAPVTDANLVNPWGVSFAPGGPLWVSDNNSGLSTLYNVAGVTSPTIESLVVTVPGGGSTSANPVAGNPTGQVFTGGKGFGVTNADGSRTNFAFVFAGEDGAITGWSGGTQAQIVLDNSNIPNAAGGAVYKGATLNQAGTQLYAANFRAGTVEVYDQNFKPVALSARAFVDRQLPKGYSPFNVQSIGDKIYVTYAKQNALKHDDVPGAGHGFIDVYSESGNLQRRLQHGNFLDSPWGVTVAPSTWGRIAGDILVGQFRSGNIDVFSKNGGFRGLLQDSNRHAITIQGLWDITPDSNPADAGNLYFTAGIDDETHGLFGALTFTSTPPKHHGKLSNSNTTGATPAIPAIPPATPVSPTFPGMY